MPSVQRSVPAIALAIALACAASAWAAGPADEPTITHVEVDDGRRLLPLDDFTAALGATAELRAVRRELAAAQRALIRGSRRGAKSTMRIERADGIVTEGENHYISGPPRRMREIRPSYTAVIVGDTLCFTQFLQPPACEPARYTFGLPLINWDAVTFVARAPAACAVGQCRRIEVRHQRTMRLHIQGRDVDLFDPDGYQVEHVTIDTRTRRPVAVASSEFRDGELVVSALETFDFESPVEPIELPADRDRSDEAR